MCVWCVCVKGKETMESVKFLNNFFVVVVKNQRNDRAV